VTFPARAAGAKFGFTSVKSVRATRGGYLPRIVLPWNFPPPAGAIAVAADFSIRTAAFSIFCTETRHSASGTIRSPPHSGPRGRCPRGPSHIRAVPTRRNLLPADEGGGNIVRQIDGHLFPPVPTSKFRWERWRPQKIRLFLLFQLFLPFAGPISGAEKRSIVVVHKPC